MARRLKLVTSEMVEDLVLQDKLQSRKKAKSKTNKRQQKVPKRSGATLSTSTTLDNLTLDSYTMASIVDGTAHHCFSVLGMHDTANADYKVARAFLPGALSVDVMSASGKTKLGTTTRLHASGFFEGFIKRKRCTAYRLRVRYPLITQVLDDPYQYPSQLSDYDLYLFNQGKHERAYEFLGANHHEVDGVSGILFAVWAPNAKRVALVADFNHWDGRVHVMRKHHDSGIWEIFIPRQLDDAHYKFQIHASDNTLLPLKSDPYAKKMQLRPSTASTVNPAKTYEWQDQQWMKDRANKQHHVSNISIYEVHLGSWRRTNNDDDFISYKTLADELIDYVVDMGFTHIQLMPINEHPFDGSWGYQPIGLFAPTSRFGDPDQFRYFVDQAHQHKIGILLDWVPGHFPNDEHGLGFFDGTHLYEHEDPRRGFHPDWNTLIYNYERPEVVSYLLSNALYWLKEFHLDGLRFDAVASMLYLDYSRKPGEWVSNKFGGRENFSAISLLQLINARAYCHHPDVMMIAEESTAWPGVTDLTENGGLGFGFKWNLGWMNDSLSYMSRDPIHRQFHHNEMTFGLLYAFNENFILPLSHDEVVHGKRALLEKMPGDDWQKFANLRAYLAFMWCHPGKKLLFMGGEFAQRREWHHDRSLDWELLSHPSHAGIQSLVRDLNATLVTSPSLYKLDFFHEGFEWLEASHTSGAIFIFVRHSADHSSLTLCACNFAPTAYEDFRIGVPLPGDYREKLNTNSEYYGGTGQGNMGLVSAETISSHGRDWSINITLPPLATLIFEWSEIKQSK